MPPSTIAVRLRWALAAALMAAGLAACASARSAPEPAAVRPGWSETGLASWYGPGFHGRPTASGEIYDMDALTAAHPWLPFQTMVRVENRENRRTAVVRINDRGPFKRGRIIDLSRRAARELGLLAAGTAKVRLTVLELSEEPPGCSELQLGAFREPENVHAALERVRRAGLEARVEPGPEGLSRVIAGPFEELAEARRARKRLGGVLQPCRRPPSGYL